ncbi:hypothetical protein AC579_1617 [Pseudocercospora musae]|uniref:protein-tyrosine-phosphatase n=1 Tax=Pseudocercospora musae TaxID=113226 RepID=A0A139HHD9_9PEZI|nr:hypothetical protein AC579_1617 [Pseudocercospora musae]
MTDTATSPPYQPPPPPPPPPPQRPSQRPTTTPSTNPAMTPFLSPPITSPQPRHAPHTPSPNYFAFHTDATSFLTHTPGGNHAKNNWSSPSSTLRSTAAISPSLVPLDQSAEHEAFRKQSESSKTFNLGGLNNFNMAMPGSSTPSSRPSHDRTSSRSSLHTPSKPGATPRDIPAASHRNNMLDTSHGLSRSPKRVLSPGSKTESRRRRASPPTFDGVTGQAQTESPRAESPKSAVSEHQRFQLPLDNLTASYNATKARAETIPVTSDPDDRLMVPPQHVVNLINSKGDNILLLDLRVQTQYAHSHIMTALNLCIPTTLLKRPSFNVQKLADTFKDATHRARFENWRKSSHIIVYDGNSSLLKDATICMNTIKKFQGEGFAGTLFIIRGGFNEFATNFSAYVESGVDASPDGAPANAVDNDGPKVAPVIGGCPMPSTDKPANPFFGIIRQNMDLIGGVGQIPIQHPNKETKSAEEEYPNWLKSAAEERDQGKKVSQRFERIERREKKRMEDALSGKVSWGTPKQETGGSVRIAGLEKGNKNRYNNIWPFEHSRVKLQGVPSHGCDYFNASHIKAAWSNKRYISTQAPIPGTFNDFWNVVWQQDVRVIVMLTAEKEGAQVKAHNYWNEKQYGSIHLEFLSEKRASLEPPRIKRHQKRPSTVKRHSTNSSNPQVPPATLDSREEKGGDRPYVIMRKFLVRHDRFPFEPQREVTQLQYSNWPDFGAPAHPAHLLGLVEQTNAVVRANNKTNSTEPEPPNKRPILVHCSAGCGRTGTFCTVDSVIDMLKRQHISRGSRQGTPMDVDKPPPRKESGGGGGGGGFFASQSQYQDNSESIDGPWTHKDDLDLVEKTVEDFRHQRISMVQSLRQYVLCYESIMEWLVQERESAKSATN